MADIHHEIKVRADPERLRAALGTREALEAWHGGTVREAEGGWRFAFADGPTFHWQVVTHPSGEGMTWRCTAGPGDSTGTEATFAFLPQPDGRTLVEFSHRGWPHTGGNFRKCNTNWAILLHQLRQFVETGRRPTT